MNRETKEALKGSIKKWRDIKNGEGGDKGVRNCPLCGLFYSFSSDCSGCPVKKAAGKGDCRNTPYEEWHDHQEISHNAVPGIKGLKIKKSCKKCKELATAEWKFLLSLLPKK